MEDDSSFYKKPGCGIWLFFFGMFAAFIAAFWKEIPPALFGWMNIFQFFLSDVPLDLSEETALAMFSVTLTVVAYLFILLISLFVVAQFALPVRSWQDRRKAFVRLLLYLVGWHGPAISVREGRVLSRQDETDSFAPGVALVDLSSAVVLEHQSRFIPEGNDWQEESPFQATSIGETRPFNRSGKRNGQDNLFGVRVEGPGVVFTKWGEKITTAIDLRKQIRTELNVQSFTRDGIELNNIVFAVFSLSDAPDIIQVGYVGGTEKDNIFGLTLVEDELEKTVHIKEKYELDPEDKTEIHNYVMRGIEPTQGQAEFSNQATQAMRIGKTPYPFHEQRVFRAAYAQALVQGLGPGIDTSTPWHELPQRVAVNLFRKEMEHYNFDELFKMNQPDIHPLREFKENFGRKVKFQGILSYKLIKPTENNTPNQDQDKWNATPFKEDEIGFVQSDKKRPRKIWQSSNLIRSLPRNFFASKILRDRGIKIIAVGFPEFRPARKEIKDKLIENWKARWDRDIQITEAEHALEAMRAKNRARSTTQREMTYTMSNLFSSSPHSKEALALRIFQALEEAATNPLRKNDLTPKEVLSMLQNLHRWLLIERKDLEKKSIDMQEQKENKQKHREQHRKTETGGPTSYPDGESHSMNNPHPNPDRDNPSTPDETNAPVGD